MGNRNNVVVKYLKTGKKFLGVKKQFIQQLKLVGQEGYGLFLLDRELAKRAAPSEAQEE